MKDELKTLLRRVKEKDMLPLFATKYIIFNKYDKVVDIENQKFKEHKQEVVAVSYTHLRNGKLCREPS